MIFIAGENHEEPTVRQVHCHTLYGSFGKNVQREICLHNYY